jgi:ubiquinone/menaquinone biosynthesis C-methylase UbiE
MTTYNYDLDTPRYIAHGLNIFQANLVDGNEFKTVELIHAALKPHQNSVIMDFGTGIGGVPKLMLEIDPTLKFLCVSNSKFQTDYIDAMNHKSIAAINCDFHSVPLPDNSIDYAMFNETIGYGDLPVLLQEVSRLLKIGGRVVIKDFTTYCDDELNDMFFQIWGYRLHHFSEYESVNLKPVLADVVLNTNGYKFNDFVKNDPFMRARYMSYTQQMLARAGDAANETVVLVLQKEC